MISTDGDDAIRSEGYDPAGQNDAIVSGGHDSAPVEPEPAADGTTAETLAFYLPFHFYRANWGIYVKATGVWALARRLGLSRKASEQNTLDLFDPAFPLCPLTDNFLIASDAFIHAGFNAMKTLWRSTPNG